LAHGLHNPQPSPHGPLGVIFVRQRVAEVDEQAIAEILGDMPVIARNHPGAGVLIGPHHCAQLFRVQLAGEHGRVYQVTEQHRELATFRIRGTYGCRWGDGIPGGVVCLRWRRVHRPMQGGRWQGRRPRGTGPDQHSALLIHGTLVDLDDLHLQIIEVRLVEVELALKRPIGDATALAEQRQDLIQHRVKVHDRSSLCLPGSARTMM
jgi:hypothetical protein